MTAFIQTIIYCMMVEYHIKQFTVIFVKNNNNIKSFLSI